MIEYTLLMSIGGAIAAYGLTSTWIAFNWLYIRPKTIKKQNAKIEELINKINKMNEQLSKD